MQKILSCILDIGEQMLLSGAEVHRVEDSIERMCSSYEIQRVDVFSITSSLVVTVFMKNGERYTETRRINGAGSDMERLHRLNQLSRKICSTSMSEEDIKIEFQKCLETKPYPTWLVCLSYGMIAAAFTAFFGGNFRDIVVSPIIGILISFLVQISERFSFNRILSKFLCSFLVTSLSHVAWRIGAIPHVDMVIIGNIMVLIPGIGLTNAIRDLFVGDNIAGLLRLIEAGLLALAIGAGYFLFVWMIGGAM